MTTTQKWISLSNESRASIRPQLVDVVPVVRSSSAQRRAVLLPRGGGREESAGATS